MKTVIFAGGFGTRIGEESVTLPKPLIEIGGMPILWHIMKRYLHYGHNDFIIACGYKAQLIKKFFVDYALYSKDLTIDCCKNEISMSNNLAEDWKVTLIDTGLKTNTGTRLQMLKPLLENEEHFFLTYGDGVADVEINTTLKFHKAHKKALTITAVQPSERFGLIDFEIDKVVGFKEKEKNIAAWVNGGYFVCNPVIFDYIPQVSAENPEGYMWEQEPMINLTRAGEVMGYKHDGFWQCMDTLREKQLLNKHWNEGNAPWKCWD